MKPSEKKFQQFVWKNSSELKQTSKLLQFIINFYLVQISNNLKTAKEAQNKRNQSNEDETEGRK